MKIGYLSIVHEIFQFKQFAEIAREIEINVDYVLQEKKGPEELNAAWQQLRSLIDESDAFIVNGAGYLLIPEFVEPIHARVADGARLLFLVSPNMIDLQNQFFARYDICMTEIGIRSHGGKPVTYSRSAGSFRDLRLFAGVDEIVVSNPNALWYGGESLPLLVGADSGVAVNIRQDLLVEWNRSELASIVGWQSETGGGVLALSGSYIGDPFRDRPGIEDNVQFAKNLLRYLSEGLPADSPSGLVNRIEANLIDFVLNRLRSSTFQWWTELVPEKIRHKCERRASAEGKGIPLHAYLDLIDLKVLIEKNWSLFEMELKGAGIDGGKNRALSWMNRLNDLRKYVAHAIKQHVANFQISIDDRTFLKHYYEVSRELGKLNFETGHKK